MKVSSFKKVSKSFRKFQGSGSFKFDFVELKVQKVSRFRKFQGSGSFKVQEVSRFRKMSYHF